MPLMRELVRAYQAFETCDASHLRRYKLTTPQADVIFTLGNTDGMTFKDVGKHTLITKGTLTGVVDRLALKSIVKRVPCSKDRRSMYITLTDQGNDLFEHVFPDHVAYLKNKFDSLSQSELVAAVTLLKKIRRLF